MLDGFEQTRIGTSGAEINLRKAGQGPPLLLLHGYPQTLVMWHKIAPALAKRSKPSAAMTSTWSWAMARLE